MSSKLDLAVLDSEMALAVCVAARRLGSASADELAKAVGKKGQSSLKRVLPKLTGAGALKESRRRRKGREATIFALDPRWSTAVEEAARRASLGRLQRGGRAFLVGADGLEGAAELLRDERYRKEVGWIAEFEDSSIGLLIVLREGADDRIAAGLVPALRRRSPQPERSARLMVGRVMDQAELGEWCADVLGGSDSPARLEA